MDNAEIYRLRQVTYRYPTGALALDSVNLAVRSGDRLAILGANGCGKSTLLKILDGLLFPASGAAAAFGVTLSESGLLNQQFAAAFRERVGFIFQRADVQLFCPTVWDEIAFGPLQLGMPADEVRERVEDVIDMLSLGDLRERTPYQLSGGEQKKVAIASVLSLNPDVLLLDEPTAALDPRTQRWLITLLQSLQRAGKTTVIATHDLDLLPELADRALVLGQDHTVERDADLSEILADHDLLHRANLAHHHLAPAPVGTAPVLEPAPLHGAHQHEHGAVD